MIKTTYDVESHFPDAVHHFGHLRIMGRAAIVTFSMTTVSVATVSMTAVPIGVTRVQERGLGTVQMVILQVRVVWVSKLHVCRVTPRVIL